jgi:hypothetical protein
MNDRRFYVYEHWRPDIGACFYVGKGQTHRAYQMRHGRNRHHKAITAKLIRLGLVAEVKIIAQSLSNEEACAMEIQRIAFWINDGADLANISSGGEKSSVGVKRSAEHRQRIAENNRARKGKASPETRALRSKMMMGNQYTLGRKFSPEEKARREATYEKRRGVPHTPEVKAKISAAKLANPSFKGGKHTPEVMARIAAGRVAYWTPERKIWQSNLSKELAAKRKADKELLQGSN